MRNALLVILLATVLHAHAQYQRSFTRRLQFSLAPGISTNGMHPAGYSNYISFNITSGISSANHLFELAGISNLNVHQTRGLQFAGLVNLTGSNAYAGMLQKQIDEKIKAGFEANLSGGQFAGLANVVLNNVFGMQVAGGANVVKGALIGVQLAGISNTVYKYSFGAQIAGLYNVSVQDMDGVQIAGLFNITTGGLYGVQLGTFNRAGFINGINSETNPFPTGLQLGLVNVARTKMNGYQVGLVNFGALMQGTQIGLVNFYRGGRAPQTRDGTSIGLVNIGSSGFLSLYASELFQFNVEVATGTVKNRRVTGDSMERQFQNVLIFSNQHKFITDAERWAFGYGAKKMYFNRSAQPGYGRIRFLSFGTSVLHVNHDRRKVTKELSLLARPEISAGSRFHPKNSNFFFFASVAYNFYWSASSRWIDTSLSSVGSGMQQWPGMAIGVLVQ